MLIDILIIVLVIYNFLLGRKRGFTLEFFGIIKYLAVFNTMNYFYPKVASILKIGLEKQSDKIQVYIITFILLYFAYTIIIFLSRKLLIETKLSVLHKFLGGILGIIKSAFIIFIIYIFCIIGANYSEAIRTQRNQSKIVEEITQHVDMDFDALPAFIKKDIMRYKRKMKAKIIKNKLIKEYKENRMEKESKKNENTR